MTTAITIIGLGLAAYFLYRLRFWYKEGQKMQQVGYLPPPPSIFGRAVFRMGAAFFRFLYIGPVKVIGKENANFKGRLLVAPNHQFAFDFAAVAGSLPFSCRQIASANECKGVRALPAVWVGTIAVHVGGGKAQDGAGQATVKICGNVLTQTDRSRLLMFPQGKLVYDNVLRPEDFRTGAVRAMKEAEQVKDGVPLGILPMGVVYHRDPSQRGVVHHFVNMLGFHNFRKVSRTTQYGATVVIGKPILAGELPDDAHAATELVRTRIQELVDVAAKY